MLKLLRSAWAFALGLAFSAPGASSVMETWERGFAKPPESARPWVYWYFMDGN
ncbi:MAG: hypothetical protein JNL97_12000, partial [Verrucomicrobiales bacterium]|nr:hypothetical protein [Verrucomicrobiales bacterium]